MENKLKIKLKIGNRVYPLTINPDQEQNLRESAKKIELLVEKLEKSYAVRDKQDVLAMCALQFASQTRNSNYNSDLNIKIQRLNDLISDHVKNN